MAKSNASGFTISGLLDQNVQTRSQYPVKEIPIEQIQDHRDNVAYSMNPSNIEQLARSIEKDGLTDLPLVRKLDDGSWQMISGHRRKAAFALLAEKNASYEKMPCRIIRDISDEQSSILLHAANYFVRNLTITERAAASKALGFEVERMRAENPELSGTRTEDIKAAIISEQTGRKISGKSIQRQEALASTIENDLSPEWKKPANEGSLSSQAVKILSKLPKDEQSKLHAQWAVKGDMSKRDTTEFISTSTAGSAGPDAHLRRAESEIQKYLTKQRMPVSEADKDVIETILKFAEELKELV